MEGDSGFSKYMPQHPLPEAIQEMKRDDTICQYCGVSYLIHNEIKRLEEKLEKYEEELKLQKGWKDEKEALLCDIEKQKSITAKIEHQLKEEQRSKKVLETLNIEKEKQNIILADEVQGLKENIEKANRDSHDMKRKSKQLMTIITVARQQHRQIKNAIQYTKEVTTAIPSIAEEFNRRIQGTLESLSEQHIQEYTELMKTVKDHQEEKMKLEEKLHSINEEIQQYKNENKNLSEFSKRLVAMEKEMLGYKDKIVNLEIDNRQLIADFEATKDTLSKKEKLLLEQANSINRERSEAAKSVMDLKEKLEKKEQYIETLTIGCKEKEDKLLQFEKNGSQAQKLLLNATEENKSLKIAFSKQQQELKDLKVEREQLIEAHQNRIQQLRESFFEKLKEADAWPVRLKDELTKQQETFNAEKNELWKELTESHQKNMQLCKETRKCEMPQESLGEMTQKLKERLSRAEMDLKEATEKFKAEKQNVFDEKIATIKKLQSQLSNAEDRWRSEQKKADSRLQQEKESSSLIIKDQLTMIGELEEKIRCLEQQKLNQSGEKDKKRSAECDKMLSLANEEIVKLEKDLNDSKLELHFLHETVRKECEERIELTEALTQARTQLLSYMRTNPSPSLRSVESKQYLANIVPSPPAVNRSLQVNNIPERSGRDSKCSRMSRDPKTSEEESRQRIAAAIKKHRSSSRTSLYDDAIS